MAPRRIVLLTLLAATLAAVWWVGGEEADAPAVVEPARRAGPDALSPDPSPRGGGEIAPPSPMGGEGGGGPEARFIALGPDLFPPQSWRPPPQPVVLPPPPPPQAPPVPFRYLGRWREDGRETLFLAEGDRTRGVHLGERLGAWQVEAINEQSMTLRYLPLDQTRTLRLAP